MRRRLKIRCDLVENGQDTVTLHKYRGRTLYVGGIHTLPKER